MTTEPLVLAVDDESGVRLLLKFQPHRAAPGDYGRNSIRGAR